MSGDEPDDRTAQVRRYWDKQAGTYDRMMDRVERLVVGDGRQWVCGQAAGRTLEVAVGTGRNLPLYPPDVHLTGIDLSPQMLGIARERAAATGAIVDLSEADAERLPFADGEFDTVVCTLSLCAVPDLDAAVVEMRRVLRPGGTLLLLDHVRPTFRPLLWILRGLQRLTDRFEPESGEQFLRRPLESVEAHGFVVERRQRFKGGGVERLAARKPDAGPSVV